MLQGVLEVAETQVRDVMVPRSQMVVLERDAPSAEILHTIIESGHSRYPVIGEDRDEVVGVLLAKDILHYFVETPDQPFDLRRFIRPAIIIPESKRLNTLLKEFRINRNHLAIVVDEFGRTAGLITIEDVLEQIVGEIEDEFDIAADEGDIFALADHSWRVAGDTPLERVNEAFGVHLGADPQGDMEAEFDTIGGLVVHEMGQVPKRGEHHRMGGLDFHVLHTKGGAVRWFKVVRVPPTEG